MMAYSCGPSSFHHSDTILAFHGSDSSFDFDDHDEATEPVYNKDHGKNDSTQAPTSSFKESSSIAVRILQEELSSSWPCDRHSSSSNNNNNCSSNHPKRKKKRRRSLRSSTAALAQEKPKKTKKTSKVRFSPTLEVRTHSIVLGDHPFCEDGLAIELGWDYVDSRDLCYQRPKSAARWRKFLPNYPNPPAVRSSSPPRQLSSLERKHRLLEVGGCSETEIKLRQFQTRILLQVQSIQDEHHQALVRRSPPSSSNNNKTLYAAMA